MNSVISSRPFEEPDQFWRKHGAAPSSLALIAVIIDKGYWAPTYTPRNINMRKQGKKKEYIC
jgi:hypothetical protein